MKKSVKVQEVRGRWNKNRNDGYKKKKTAKNTQKKIQKAKRSKNENDSWNAGGPRPIVLLKTIGLDNLLQVGMFWHSSHEAELAITEHAELGGRLIQFNREGNRLRAWCTSQKPKKVKCTFVVNVRQGEQRIVGEDNILFGWHITKISPHNCNIFRDGKKSMYSPDLLARSLLTKVKGLTTYHYTMPNFRKGYHTI